MREDRDRILMRQDGCPLVLSSIRLNAPSLQNEFGTKRADAKKAKHRPGPSLETGRREKVVRENGVGERAGGAQRV
eukprot:1542779-Pyramimonas_sp.AAC.1